MQAEFAWQNGFAHTDLANLAHRHPHCDLSSCSIACHVLRNPVRCLYRQKLCECRNIMLRGSARAVLSKVPCMPAVYRRWLASAAADSYYRSTAVSVWSPLTHVLQVKPSSWAQQRHFAEAVAPKFDWDSLESSIASDEGKRDLSSLRSTWIDVRQKFDTMAQVSCQAPIKIFY